jgi:hypothetical protein
MIIWRGMGLVIPFIFAIAYFITKYFLAEDLKTSALNFGIALVAAGVFILLTIKKRERDLRKLFEGEDTEKIEKYRQAIEANPTMDIDNSDLFFIPFKYWPYVMGVGGIVLCIVHFVNG